MSPDSPDKSVPAKPCLGKVQTMPITVEIGRHGANRSGPIPGAFGARIPPPFPRPANRGT